MKFLETKIVSYKAGVTSERECGIRKHCEWLDVDVHSASALIRMRRSRADVNPALDLLPKRSHTIFYYCYKSCSVLRGGGSFFKKSRKYALSFICLEKLESMSLEAW